MILKNGQVLVGDKLEKRDILIYEDKIANIAASISGDNEIDISDMLVIPGAIDPHVHLREPGFEYKETSITACKSAAKGGITTVMAMPNIKPAPDSLENIEYILGKIRKDVPINVYQFGSLTKGMQGEEVSDIESFMDLVPAISDDGPGTPNLETLYKGLELTSRLGLVTSIHAEAKGLGFKPEAEYKAVEDTIAICRDTGASVHFCHLSTKKAIEYAVEAKREGLDITFEVTPHHLFLNEKDIKNTNYKMNPPLRSEEDREAVEYSLVNGDALCVATDHAPHSKEEKDRKYDKAPCGIIGLETMLPLVYTNLVMTGKISLSRFIDISSKNAGQRFNLYTNDILTGDTANITVLDINNKHEYSKAENLSKGENSPFFGYELYGFPVLTICKGQIVYKR